MNDSTSRVLIVDDHPVNRRLATLLLRNAGIDSEEASSGEEAMEKLCARSFACVLLDVNMPGLSGEQVCEYIRADEQLAGLRVVAYTAHAFDSEQRRILAAGFDDLLTKPITKERLLAVIEAR
ncbi:MAG: response regulator [Proteobacteria bacterium]|nr:response regulator [Pseudomonadota bacterium]